MQSTKQKTEKTQIIKFTDNDVSETIFENINLILQNEGVFVFPTDTVYGIGALPCSQEAIKRIYAVKNRPLSNPLTLLISDISVLDFYVFNVSSIAKKIMDAFWPGQVTIVLPATKNLENRKKTTKNNTTKYSIQKFSNKIISDYGTISFRMPNHSLLLSTIKKIGGAIISTSANESGVGTSVKFVEIKNIFYGKVEIILDGGDSKSDIPSTVVLCKNNEIEILREGQISEQSIRNIL